MDHLLSDAQPVAQPTQKMIDRLMRVDINLDGEPTPERSQFFELFVDQPGEGADIDRFFTNFPRIGPEMTPRPLPMQRVAKSLCQIVHDDWKFINRIVLSHGTEIQQKWSAMSTKRRKKMLVTVLPEISPYHRPDIVFTEAYRWTEAKSEFWRMYNSRAVTAPYINAEDLSKPLPLMLLLSERATHAPDKFMMTEYVRAPLICWSESSLCEIMPNYTMSLATTSGQKFGEVSYWSNPRDCIAKIAGGHTTHLLLGVHTLLTQSYVLSFLRTICTDLLGDDMGRIIASPTSLMNHITLQRPDVMTFSDVAIEAAYCLPGYDFSLLMNVILAKISELEEHIWNLREDPSYFAETYSAHYDHNVGSIKVNGRTHFEDQPCASVTARLLHGIMYVYIQLQYWCKCRHLVGELVETRERQVRGDLPDNEAYALYSRLLTDLWENLYLLLVHGKVFCQEAGITAPKMRPYFVFTHTDPHVDGRKDVVAHRYRDMWMKDTKIFLFLTYLSEFWNKQAPRMVGCSLEMERFEMQIEQDPAKKALISPLLAYGLSQMSVASLCIHYIRLYMPYDTEIFVQASKRVRAMGNPFEHLAPGAWKLLFDSEWSNNKELTTAADPSDGKFEYPIQKGNSKSKLRQVMQAETNLDRMWWLIDRHCEKTMGQSLQQMLGYDFTHGRKLERHCDEATVARPRPTTQIPAPDTSYLHHDPASQITGTFDKGAAVQKKKRAKKPTNPTVAQADIRQASDDSVVLQPKSSLTVHTQRATPSAVQENLSRADDGTLSTLIEPLRAVESVTEILEHSDDRQVDGLPRSVLSDVSHASASTLPTPFGPLDDRARRVFRAFFHSSSTDFGRMVPWASFLHAMVSAGFGAQKLGGSMWQFMHKDAATYGIKPMQFHEPHPGSKIEAHTAQFWGRRLNRAYGWSGEMFD